MKGALDYLFQCIKYTGSFASKHLNFKAANQHCCLNKSLSNLCAWSYYLHKADICIVFLKPIFLISVSRHLYNVSYNFQKLKKKNYWVLHRGTSFAWIWVPWGKTQQIFWPFLLQNFFKASNELSSSFNLRFSQKRL